MARKGTRRGNHLREIIFGNEKSLFELSNDSDDLREDDIVRASADGVDNIVDDIADNNIGDNNPTANKFRKSSRQIDSEGKEERIFTVSELTGLIRLALDVNLPERLLVSGEISNLSQPNSGHIYFTLKDEHAQINCVIWRSVSSKIKFSIEDGLAVIAGGRIDVYAPRGQYQLYVDMLKPAGVGELELAFRQLKEKLERQGLFDISHKLSVPEYPFTIAVITSPTGAAIRDIIRTLNLRWPVGRVLIYPVQVQGEQAKNEISKAIEEINLYADELDIDVIILARGGGSLEDLWAFNEEIVARAIYKSRVPIITGIGHEIDITIADLVADLRSATPTAAAQQATPKLEDVLNRLDKYVIRMRNVIDGKLYAENRHLKTLANRAIFRNPKMILSYYIQKLDETSQYLRQAIISRLTRTKSELNREELRLSKVSPNVLLTRSSLRLRHSGEKLISAMHARYDKNVLNMAHLRKRLENCDYRRVLKRGFAIVRDAENNGLITSAKQAKIDSQIETELADGVIKSRVIKNFCDTGDNMEKSS